MRQLTCDTIATTDAVSLSGLFVERVKRTPDAIAYKQFETLNNQWQSYSWKNISDKVDQWAYQLQQESLQAGDRVAMMMSNSIHWVIFDQAALKVGLVTVPLYTNDRPDNVAFILADADVKLLMIDGSAQWNELKTVQNKFASLQRIITCHSCDGANNDLLVELDSWIKTDGQPQPVSINPKQLASIVYTSGTTGKPKGVMLSHLNMLSNAEKGLAAITIYQQDVLLSFLPLSHTLERTIGYYLSIMSGSTVVYSRSIPLLGEDLLTIKPTILVSVPRIFERVYGKIQAGLEQKSAFAQTLFKLAIKIGWKKFLIQQRRSSWHPNQLLWPILNQLVAKKVMAKLGGNMRFAISGGAALNATIAQTFIGLGLPIIQGYGLTETSPVISVNHLDKNQPASVGIPFDGIEVKIAENNELLTRSDCVMQGYWNNPSATKEVITPEGWLHTGDKVKIEDSHIYITGRLKEIIVLSTGEKVPPNDMEMAIALNPLFEQVMVIGEQKPYLSALIVVDPDQLKQYALNENIELDLQAINDDTALIKKLLKEVSYLIKDFPGYARIHQIHCCLDAWTVENELLTATMKLKRHKIESIFNSEIESLYAGH
jgi:long-chain acyl-CoA synthetase